MPYLPFLESVSIINFSHFHSSLHGIILGPHLTDQTKQNKNHLSGIITPYTHVPVVSPAKLFLLHVALDYSKHILHIGFKKMQPVSGDIVIDTWKQFYFCNLMQKSVLGLFCEVGLLFFAKDHIIFITEVYDGPYVCTLSL